ncbi:DUF5324 family protein [Streptomyces sp. NPDC004549]|uniref:DUF5324 family protein n=1 Tax=unclassified Streptomyces TaxID=2593676 RepID=UPI0018F68BE1|nr:DUF5324 family protein [Streptomyces sp. DSM 110735]MBJ7902000.1 DUF5324 family protein [Streptomyces sp. DSM 110735]
MTRIESVRAATGSAKDSVLHAADVVAPYADTAKERAAYYAQEARVRLAPVMSQAADQARVQYDALLAPRLEQARAHVPPKVDQAAQDAAERTRKAAKQAAEYSRPRIEQAVAAATPVYDEAATRGAAALVALRGNVSAKQIKKLARRNERRGTARTVLKYAALASIVAGTALAVWKWWDKQANPDWLVEPPAATEMPDAARLHSVDGTGTSPLDPEVRAKQNEEDSSNGDENR